MSFCVSLSFESYRSATSEKVLLPSNSPYIKQPLIAHALNPELCIISLSKMYINYTFIPLTSTVLPLRAAHFVCVNQLIERCTGVQSVGEDDDYYGSV